MSVQSAPEASETYYLRDVCMVSRLRREVVGEIIHHLAAGAPVQPA